MDVEISADLAWVIARYERRLGGRLPTAATMTAGFSGAGVWRLDFPSGRWAVRRWPVPGLPESRLHGLHRLLEHLARQGLQTVAVPIPDHTGTTLISHAGSWWQVEPWLPGMADYRRQPSPQRLRTALTELANWHQATTGFVADASFEQWFSTVRSAPSPAVQERLEQLQSLPTQCDRFHALLDHSPECEQRILCCDMLRGVQALAPLLAQELVFWGDRKFALQPCLRDVWHDHVLFTGDVVTGLVDPSACRTEHVAADLSRLIGSLVEDDPRGWQIALEAYQLRRNLELDELSLVTVLDRAGVLLGAWTWIDWLYGQRRPMPDPEKVLERLRYFQRRLRALSSRAPSWQGMIAL